MKPAPAVLLLAALSGPAAAQPPATLPLRIEHRAVLSDLAVPDKPAHTLELRVVDLDHWPEAGTRAALGEAAQILSQCGIRTGRVDLLRVTAPDTHRYFDTPRSRELARALELPRPAIFLAAGTRQVPAFDAEAIGRGNSRSRPELRDTVWIARGARDLGIVIAHELAHVLMDSGAHDNTPGNLMAESTTPSNTALTAAQCAQLTATGARNGLLRGVD